MATGDRSQVYSKGKETTLLHGRFAGAGAAAPTKVAGTGRGLTIARGGVGTYTVTSDDNYPFIQSASLEVHSANAVDAKVTPYNANTRVWAVQCAYKANGTAYELTTSDELNVTVLASYTATP